MQASNDLDGAENLPARPCSRETFRAWFKGYRRTLKMETQTRNFAALWWRDLAPALRAFIVGEAELSFEATQAAVRAEFAKLAESDQERLLLVARDIMRDIKPVTWMS